MFPECREGWRDRAWAIRQEGRERMECGGLWFTQIRTGVFPPVQVDRSPQWMVGREMCGRISTSRDFLAAAGRVHLWRRQQTKLLREMRKLEKDARWAVGTEAGRGGEAAGGVWEALTGT